MATPTRIPLVAVASWYTSRASRPSQPKGLQAARDGRAALVTPRAHRGKPQSIARPPQGCGGGSDLLHTQGKCGLA